MYIGLNKRHLPIVVIALLLLLTSCHGSRRLMTGDLLFVEGAPTGALDRAIMGSTGAMVHVGIIEVSGDSVYVIDAAPKTGVARRPLEVFLDDQRDEAGLLPTLCLMRLKDNRDAAAFVAQAKSLCGAEYDFTFLPGNGQYYCSELVYECYQRDGQPLFEATPMNFKNATGEFDPYWVEHFERLGIPIPQGVLGTNPDEMSYSYDLKEISRQSSQAPPSR